MGAEKRFVLCLHLINPLGDPAEQRQVTPHMGLNIEGGDPGPKQHAAQVAGYPKLYQPAFHHRVDHDHLATAPSHTHQGRHHARMVAGRIAAYDKNQIGAFQVLQHNGGGTAAQGAGQSHPAGLVAIVAAVVHIVRAIHSGEELQQKPRLIRTASAEVPKGLPGGKTLQFSHHPFHGLGPLYGAVVLLAVPIKQRLNQPTTRLELAG